MLTIPALQAGYGWARRALGRCLLPPACCLCGFPGLPPVLDLCSVCRDLLPSSEPWAAPHGAMFSCTVVPFRYDYPVDQFVRALKFRRERLYARVLGTLLADAVKGAGNPIPQALIPVPLHPSRYRTRGFNQAFEIARFAAELLNVPVRRDCLIRITATQEQSGLSHAERQRNVRGAFRIHRVPGLQHVALVDDVLTTGSTAAEASRPLLAAGVASLELWAAARVVLE